MGSRHHDKRRDSKSSINYHSTTLNIKSFDSDALKPKNPSKSENKVTTSQLRSTLAGIWSYIGQSEGFKSNKTPNYDTSNTEIGTDRTSVKSTFEDLNEMKRRLFLVPVNNDEHILAWYKYRREIYKPNYLIETENKSNIYTNSHTNESTEDQDNLPINISTQDLDENIKQEEIIVSESTQIGFTNSNEITNTPKELSESPSSLLESTNTNENNTDEKFEKDQNVISIKDRVQNAISINRHALAGALAGTMVSVCLHPIDTIKTIIQSNKGNGSNSFHGVLKSTLTQRGVFGLYRGVASNIASSAPISAIYTFTYESVKGTLIPIFPKDYQSLTHCISGGCSSIATSFVFTPSERIKQQMQVGTHYQNCWSALIGCIEKGGVASLYAGWGAVLCRNIPHSIIKFYTYERLKQFTLSQDSTSAPRPFQTLLCGGLAGSTAALFTTPFDVVKTRIQTQCPSKVNKHNGVIHTLKEITKKEGLHSLYRGLTPRLGMYVSQGAIFFASYEFLKSFFEIRREDKPR